jgi:deazaflavin-dependent oxidoreductase (nitroreductase family)
MSVAYECRRWLWVDPGFALIVKARDGVIPVLSRMFRVSMATFQQYRPRKPHGLLRWGFNLPIMLYRARLGWLLGRRFLLLTHRGRTTGKLRRTVLEVFQYDRIRHESIVLSAYGERADWYRNLLAHPAVEVRTGRSQYVPQYRLLGPDERLAALRIYQWAFRAVMRLLGYPYDGSEASLSGLAERVLMIAFLQWRRASTTRVTVMITAMLWSDRAPIKW